MELEEFKNSRHAMKAPLELPGEGTGVPQLAIDNVIEMLKTEDAKQLTMLKRARPLWMIAAVFWIVSSAGILLTGLESPRQLDSGFPLRGLIALIFLGLGAAFVVQTKKLSRIDYTEPASLFLRKAAQRYQFMSTPSLVLSIVITSILALACSMYIVDVFERYLDIHDASAGIVASFAFVAFVYLFGYFASKKSWKKTRAPMLEQIKKMQEDLQGNGDDSPGAR